MNILRKFLLQLVLLWKKQIDGSQCRSVKMFRYPCLFFQIYFYFSFSRFQKVLTQEIWTILSIAQCNSCIFLNLHLILGLSRVNNEYFWMKYNLIVDVTRFRFIVWNSLSAHTQHSTCPIFWTARTYLNIAHA